MRHMLIFLLAGVIAPVAIGQTPPSGQVSTKDSVQAAAQSAPAAIVAAGTTFNAVLVGSLDARRANAGDAVSARVTEDVLSAGKIVVPRNSRLAGHVVKSSARAKGDTETAIAVQFDKAVLKSGEEIRLVAVIQAFAPPQEIELATSAGDVLPPPPTNSGASGGRFIGGAGGTINNAVNAAVSAGNQAAATADANARPAANASAGAGISASGSAAGWRAPGRLSTDAKGAVGFTGLTLDASANAGAAPAIQSSGASFRLDSGTRLLLVIRPPRRQSSGASPPRRASTHVALLLYSRG